MDSFLPVSGVVRAMKTLNQISFPQYPSGEGPTVKANIRPSNGEQEHKIKIHEKFLEIPKDLF